MKNNSQHGICDQPENFQLMIQITQRISTNRLTCVLVFPKFLSTHNLESQTVEMVISQKLMVR